MTVAETRTSPLLSVTAAEAMRPGVITVPSRTSLHDVALTMSLRGVHAVVVTPDPETAPTAGAVVGDLDMVRAVLDGDPATTAAGELAAGSLPVVDRRASLQDVASVMVDRGSGHVLVAESEPFPAGVLSTFDLVAVIGGHDPRFARAVRPGPARPALSESRLDHVSVKAAMHPGVLACPPSAPITAVAGLLADHRVHCTAVSGVTARDAGTEHLASGRWSTRWTSSGAALRVGSGADGR